MAQFSTPEKVQTILEASRKADEDRATNRALINDLFNGFPPFTEAQAKENKIQTNVNFLEGTNIAHAARNQLYNAFLRPDDLFAVKYDKGPQHQKMAKGRVLTAEINRVIKKSLPYTEAARATHAQIILHGIGPRIFRNKSAWCPKARSIADVLVPSGTEVDMDSMDHFFMFESFTAAQLYRATHGKLVDPGWNVKLAERLVAALLKEPMMATNWDNWRFPEKLSESIKSDSGYYGSDAVPAINTWSFYYKSEDGTKWHKKILLDCTSPTSGNEARLASEVSEAKKRFLYDPKERVEADELSQIMHVQFADCSSVAPFKWHSVRAIGMLLFNICQIQNRYRCRLTDAQMMELLWFFRNVPEEDREKLLQIQLVNMGIIPQGVDFVTGPERYHPDPNMIALGLAQNRQLMAENSASFVQDISREQGRSDETATLTMAKIQNANAMISGMLNLAYIYETHLYYEMARRFCTSADSDCQEFRRRCLEKGLEKECFDVEAWEIKPERVLGAGNKTLEIAQADRLMAARGAMDPEAQRIVLHKYVDANAEPGDADMLVPLDREEGFVSRSENQANLAVGTLMHGVPVPLPREISILEYAQTLVTQLMLMTQRIEKTGGMVDESELRGLVTVDQQVRELMALLEQDEAQEETVRQMQDALGQAENLIKAFAQRLQEKQQASQVDPETMAKVQAIGMTTQAKVQSGKVLTAQKFQQKDVAFRQKLQQTAVKNAQTNQQKAVQTAQNLQAMQQEQAAHVHQLMMDQEGHEAELEQMDEKAKAEVEAMKAKAETSNDKAESND